MPQQAQATLVSAKPTSTAQAISACVTYRWATLFRQKLLANTIIQSLKAGFTVTNVLMTHSNMNGIDPESVFATSTNATGFEFTGLPTTRSFVFNVSIGF